MARETLAGFFDDLASITGEFLVYDDGSRTRRYTYADVTAAARGFAARLHDAGVRQGDAVLFWSENRPEWIAAFWGAVVAGVVVVPIDYRSSLEFARRVVAIVKAKAALVGEDVTAVDAREAAAHGLLGETVAWPMAALDWRDRRPSPDLAVPLRADDTVEIIFTSGATAEPKGVVLTHRNVLANIVPIETEVRKYRRWGRPFFPLRFLDLLPLSHMFGQAMATFVPPMLPGTVVFMRGYNPAEIVSQVRKRRVSVLVSVPKILDVLADYVRRTEPLPAPAGGREHVARRWWRYRALHRRFGFKFWSLVVGAAPLDPALEEFWSRVGFLVIQGYGLTETAPIVTLNHPFAARKGSVGKALGGVEVRIAPDGEILVRGDNVTRGYLGEGAETLPALDAGWLHTGDIGELDADGRLFVRGRKKEVIITPDGLNVFPEDVERALNAQPGVRESAVVGERDGAEERVHAVVVIEPGTDPEKVVRGANGQLAGHQKIRRVSTWPGAALPRTEGTRKLKRREVSEWVRSGRVPEAAPAAGSEGIEGLLARYAGKRDLRPETTIDELGLSSLERVELMSAIEQRFAAPVDEEHFAAARTVADLGALADARRSGGTGAGPSETAGMPSWTRAWPVRGARHVVQSVLLLPLTRWVSRLRVEGVEHLAGLDGPVVFAANHQSHMDTPALLAALPARWRRRVAVAMSKDYFRAHFHPEGRPWRERTWSGLLFVLAAGLFNAFPLPQRETGARQTLRHIGDLVSDGWCVLIFPEGERTETGAIGTFKPGVGMIGSRLGVPVVPVRIEGLDKVLHKTARTPTRGRARVAFGPPLMMDGDAYGALASKVEAAVRGI